MGFFEALKSCFSKYFDFSGRASRSEFWYFRLFIALTSIVLSIKFNLFANLYANITLTLLFLGLGVAIAIPDLSVQVRRLHDRDLSGFWLLPVYIVIPSIFGFFFYTYNKMGQQLTSAHEQGLLMLGVVWLVWALGVLFVCLLPGTEGQNRYGSDPLGQSKKVIYDSSQPEHIKRGQRDALRYGELEGHAAGLKQKKVFTEKVSTVAQIKEPLLEINALNDDEVLPFAPPSAEELSQAEVLAKYDKEIIELMRSIEGLPGDVVRNILIEVIRNPEVDIDECRNKSILQSLGRPDLRWSKEISAAISAVKAADSEKSQEFFRVFSTLSKRMRPIEVANRVLFFGEEKRFGVYGIRGSFGGMHELIEYVPGFYSLGTQKFGYLDFTSLDAVFDYLKTPSECRQLMPLGSKAAD